MRFYIWFITLFIITTIIAIIGHSALVIVIGYGLDLIVAGLI